jgi:integrase
MASRVRSSDFGHVDRRQSGQWRARYTDPDGRRRSRTFGTVTDARVWLSSQRTDIVRQDWRTPELANRTIGKYAEAYLARIEIKESTRALYESVWANHLKKEWGSIKVGNATPTNVRAWHATAGKSLKPTALAQAYRLLRGILNVAVQDDVLKSNPCRIKGAGMVKPAVAARSLTVSEVLAIAEEVPARYKTLVMVLAFGGLRFGEATALRRRDVSEARLTVERTCRYIHGAWTVGSPKTDAGRRTVTLPGSVANLLESHLADFVPDDPDALVFATASGRFIQQHNFGATFRRAVKRCGLPHTRVHWLRHTGATLAASTGATTKELMHRLGHASPAAALVYQHAVSERDSEIARALDVMVTGDVKDAPERLPVRRAQSA